MRTSFYLARSLILFSLDDANAPSGIARKYVASYVSTESNFDPHPNEPAGHVADSLVRMFFADDQYREEALSWLKAGGDRHTLGELASSSASVRLVNAVYRAGATKVWAVDIDRYPDGSENTGKIVIELPGEPRLRSQVLAWASRKSKAKGFGEIDDEKQHYVFLMLD
ncbi:MAG: hypothetical protein QOH88_466 [Verrucomicrobiota bacterium]|jgi:hypothetical protein